MKSLLFIVLFEVAVIGYFTPAEASSPLTPIEHLIVVIGENHSFDNLFGAYDPGPNQTISNLLSKGIIQSNGSPGPHFSRAAQWKGDNHKIYQVAPSKTGFYSTLARPNTTHAKGLKATIPDARFPSNLPNGPFQITQFVPYEAFVGDPVHRFFQMWQETDGGKMDLFLWVATTAGIGGNSGSDHGGEAMGFYNMSTGDLPLFRNLASAYAISDNDHQPVMGGTGANFIALISGDVGFYNLEGRPAAHSRSQIENPDPRNGTNNAYIRDRYRSGSYVNCSDRHQPGVSAIIDYLHALSYPPFRKGNCDPDTYYLVNNYRTGYLPDGKERPFGRGSFTLPPQMIPTIGDSLSAKGVSWKWYSGGRNSDGTTTDEYCDICDPFTFFKSLMTSSSWKEHLQGMAEFEQDLAGERHFPAVSFVRPFENQAGHPANANLSS